LLTIVHASQQRLPRKRELRIPDPGEGRRFTGLSQARFTVLSRLPGTFRA
jgi:hypothetical protein